MSRVHKRYDDDNLCKIDETIAFSEPVELPDLFAISRWTSRAICCSVPSKFQWGETDLTFRNKGNCPICEREVEFSSEHEWFRDHYKCIGWARFRESER